MNTCPVCGDPPTDTENCRECTAAMVLVLMEDAERLIRFGNFPRALHEIEQAAECMAGRLEWEASR